MILNKITKAIIIAVLIALAFFIGNYSVDKNSIEKNGYNEGYDTGYNAAWNKAKTIVDSSYMFPQKPEEIYSISGTIKNISVSNNLISIEASPVSLNPLSEDSKTTERTIKITSDTKIVRIIMRTPEEMQAAISPDQPLMPIMPFSEEEITFSQLKEGDRITVSSDRNIKKEMEFTALKITLQ